MSLRAKINDSLKEAMKSRAKERLSTLRLVNAAIKDMDISLRGEGKDEGASESDVLQILSKMVKQRQESAKTYEEGGRLDLAESELKEIVIIEEFLPQKLSEDEIVSAIDAVIAEVGAESIRDMGKVMGGLKAKYTGQMDFGQVGGMVKAQLSK
ncbi:GatB/YqeY domain-containing protein [Cognatishimia activa]|uniref:GatB/YqeY domain-containing protein n=1 Tax=Cognatishimia activa TaxID=1715691 RepID=UPI00222ED150|nr:GatB/YqeY domain-containing protein [Cognatishimia activa]UZD91443.1 GatB/YqeY domain-containing protein [Cognatishimia activa]